MRGKVLFFSIEANIERSVKRVFDRVVIKMSGRKGENVRPT